MPLKDDFKKILEQCETGVREGRVALVKRELTGLNGAKVPRELRLPFANLGRRTGMNNFGLRLLTPLVHGAPKDRADGDELAEYAVLLQRTGSLDEAFRILRGLDSKKHPQALLFLAFCHFNRWEYFEAVPVLREYLASPMPEYKKVVGQVNLAAALVATTEYREAMELLKEIDAHARANQLHRLQGNAHEIRAQALFYLGELDEAGREAAAAGALLAKEGTVAELNVKKWLAVIRAFSAKDPAVLQKFRAEALAFGEWEAVRHADLCLLQLKYTEPPFEYHLFGTPWLSYREKAQRTLGKVITSERFQFGAEGGRIIDVTGALIDGREAFPVGGKMHRVLSVLTTDFYRPLPVGAVFSHLFPGEYFDVFSSPNRVHQVMFRFRTWAAEQHLPVTVEHSDDGYSLQLFGPLILTVPYERRTPDANIETYRRLSVKFNNGAPFSLREIASVMAAPVSTARRFCNWALEQGHLSKRGAGPATRYIMSSAASQKKTA